MSSLQEATRDSFHSCVPFELYRPDLDARAARTPVARWYKTISRESSIRSTVDGSVILSLHDSQNPSDRIS